MECDRHIKGSKADVFNVHHRRWRVQAWWSWNAKAMLHWFDLVRALGAQQLVEPLSNHSCGDSFIGMSKQGLLLPLVLPLVLTLPLALVLAMILTVVALPLLSLTLLDLTLELTLELILVVLSTLQWTHITMLCQHAGDIRRKVLEIAASANVQQLFVECAARFESSLRHLTQPTSHS